MSGELCTLRIGESLYCKAGSLKILSFLGSGGQGEVYRVSIGGRDYALKYYFKDRCTQELKSSLKRIIDFPVSSPSFAWPLYLVENRERFGYVMELLPKDHRSIAEWIGGKFDTTLDVLIKACIELCDAFHALHAAGYSYKDISNLNVSFSPASGRVKIFDNDNVTPNLDASDVTGTGGFMAPEIVSGYTDVPSRLTDLHSLAVLLFQMLHGEHPLNGKKEYDMSHEMIDEDVARRELYGVDGACFIFSDKSDLDRYIEPSEAAHANARDMWEYYPEFLRDMFEAAFVRGIKKPHARPSAQSWRDAFIKLLGLSYKCPHCGALYFYDRERFYLNRGAPACDRCEGAILAPRMKSLESGQICVMSDGAIVYKCILDNNATDKLLPALRIRIDGGALRIENLFGMHFEHNGKRICRGELSGSIGAGDSLILDGKKYIIAL